MHFRFLALSMSKPDTLHDDVFMAALAKADLETLLKSGNPVVVALRDEVDSLRRRYVLL